MPWPRFPMRWGAYFSSEVTSPMEEHLMKCSGLQLSASSLSNDLHQIGSVPTNR